MTEFRIRPALPNKNHRFFLCSISKNGKCFTRTYRNRYDPEQEVELEVWLDDPDFYKKIDEFEDRWVYLI
jgi:hypothetical protein